MSALPPIDLSRGDPPVLTNGCVTFGVFNRITKISGEAVAVWARDEELDEMYANLFRVFLTYMMEDPRNIGPCTHLLFMAKNIERIGDHATNIAENLYYLVHGTPLTQARPKGDNSSIQVVAPDRAGMR